MPVVLAQMEAFWVIAVERWERLSHGLLDAPAPQVVGRWEGLSRNLLREFEERPDFWANRARWARLTDASADLARGELQLQ